MDEKLEAMIGVVICVLISALGYHLTGWATGKQVIGGMCLFVAGVMWSVVHDMVRDSRND